MDIKGMDGQSYHVTGQGQGNFNTVGSAAGIASFLGLNAGNFFGGGYGNRGMYGGGCAPCSENMPVNRYELDMSEKLNAKDSEIALLKADKYTDQKIVEAYRDLQGQIKELAGEVRHNKDAQTEVNMQQAVYNGTNNAAMQCVQGQIAQLFSLTKLVVPNSSVCPGWGPVCVQPTACPAK